MKTAIFASVLGIAFSAMTASGQGGAILFNNYISSYMSGVYRPVVYDDLLVPPGFPGKNVNDPNVELQLFYAYGAYPDIASFMAAAVAGVTTFIDTSINQDGTFGPATSKGSPGGYYRGPIQLLPDWVAGDTITFMVEGWETAGPYGGVTYGTSWLKGRTSLWTETGAALPGDGGIQPYPSQPPGYFAAGPPVLVMGIPEPATLAFAGLGLLSLMALARWRKV